MWLPNRSGEGGLCRKDESVGVSTLLTQASQPVCHLAFTELQKEFHNLSQAWLYESCHHVPDG